MYRQAVSETTKTRHLGVIKCYEEVISEYNVKLGNKARLIAKEGIYQDVSARLGIYSTNMVKQIILAYLKNGRSK